MFQDSASPADCFFVTIGSWLVVCFRISGRHSLCQIMQTMGSRRSPSASNGEGESKWLSLVVVLNSGTVGFVSSTGVVNCIPE